MKVYLCFNLLEIKYKKLRRNELKIKGYFIEWRCRTRLIFSLSQTQKVKSKKSHKQ